VLPLALPDPGPEVTDLRAWAAGQLQLDAELAVVDCERSRVWTYRFGPASAHGGRAGGGPQTPDLPSIVPPGVIAAAGSAEHTAVVLVHLVRADHLSRVLGAAAKLECRRRGAW